MSDSFTPEQQNALKALTLHLPKAKSLLMTDKKLTLAMLESEQFVFSEKSFHRLPRGEDWCWNKSRGKLSVEIDPSTFVDFHKLNARRMKQEQTPRLKVWLFEIKKSKDAPPHLFGFWCERGFDDQNETEVDPKILETDDGKTLNLSDFSFLAEFANPHVANEFGWL